MLRTRLKRIIPGPAWRLARRIHSYGRRRAIWRRIHREMEGATDADAAILKRSSRESRLKELQDLDSWHDPLLLENAAVNVRGVGKFQLRAATDDLYHVLPFRERELFDQVRARLTPGSIFIDAGANIGVFTVLAGRAVGPDGKVIAIEMVPETAERLRGHLALNQLSNVHLIERALSDRAGEWIEATIPEGRFGQASIVAKGTGKTLSVETTTLDEAMSAIEGPIALMKVDLEGAEAKAFAGATGVLRRTQAILFEELGDKRDVINLLEDAGFTVRRLAGHNFLAERS